ncbi:uncharacterized protein LOC131012739 [Salvia miltiorrhiza]|uniref:uncharacterized protein LOC131012739 n=1 Tax=Salvia miltiorrhiza TaxID=226208 RepID=UPI0025AD400C|nr:uncharacterized protein LOC131012739 [Salvia miltiorrhiza]XP_057796721.1 uncharacterized protein LOC131012739 [Salvia miltiorrhiza]
MALAADAIPRFIVVKSKVYSDKGNAYFKADGTGGGSVLLGEADVFSTVAKIEAERSTSSNSYINLRFCYSNRYWARKANSNLIVADSDQPDEDTTKPTCTLFEPVKVDDFFYLIHVQSGGHLLMDTATLAFYVESNPISEQAYLTFVDWNSLVKLPPRIAIKGDNEKYIKNFNGSLQFASDDANKEDSSYVVELRPNGNVQIRLAGDEDAYWALSHTVNSWIDMVDPFNEQNQFWPVKIDEKSIALRSVDNNNFCRRLSAEGAVDCLSASATTITNEAIMQVQEQVLGRTIYNVRYEMEYARIFDEQPYIAGSSTLTNDKDGEASMSVSITYTDEKTYTFTRSLSLTAGVSASIEAGVPFIEKATITVNYEINGTFEWGTEESTSVSVTATGSVPVPGRSTVVVDYVGTKGTCNIPYSYTQEDKSSTDGNTLYTDVSDGIYTGVNCYNYSFHVRSTQPL